MLRALAGLVALVVLLPVAASAMLPPEDYAPYQPQTSCSPNAKPGTLKLSQWLQRQYPGSGSLGISRSCRDGGVSEHKEGRAFDWAVSIDSARDRASVADFFKRAFATDSDGNKHALARRMGIMYLIWDDHIYSSYYAFSSRPYHGCRVLKGCSATLRHRNHVHISLSRAGGAGTTSWYTGAATVPPPSTTPPPTTPTPPPTPPTDGTLDLTTAPYAAVTVPADGSTTTTPFRLRAGTAYQVTAGGLYGYGDPAQVADASCRWSTLSRTWLPHPSATVTASHGSLNLRVDGQRINDSACHPRSHVYSRVVRPASTRALQLSVANTPAGATGALTVVVSRPGTDVGAGLPTYPTLAAAPARTVARGGTGLVAETVSVPAAAGSVWSTGSLEQGADYRLTVTGTARLGGGVTSDGRCVAVGGTWNMAASLDRRTPGADHAKLYVDGVPFAGRAPRGRTCASRTHVLDWTAVRTGRLTLAVWDPLTRTDDGGALSVQVQRLTPVATPPPAAPEPPAATPRWRQAHDSVRVEASAPAGALSTMRVRAGQAVYVKVTGTQRSGGLQADASCVRTGRGWVPTDARVALGQDPLALWVDGAPLGWHPVGRVSGCAADHTYSARFVATKSGPLRLAVLDLDHRDNTGALTVGLQRL